MKTKQRVLLICLKPEEKEHIERLLASFEIETESVEICNEAPDTLSLDQDISLAVFRIDENSIRPDQVIRRLRRYFSHPIPILLLLDPEMLSGIRDYLKAGADDYWVLPLDETAFSVRFYVLLEYGQTMLYSAVPKEKKEERSENSPSFLQRMIARFQDSLRYFSPRIAAKDADAPIASRWEKIRLLGAGGFGQVWLVRKTGKEMYAVAKIPHSPKMNISALRSAAILRRISVHPNAVHLIEVVKEEGKVILIQEYIQGQTLQAMLDQGIIDRIQREKIFLQLVSVMSHAHENRIMHRDIKPENMIIVPSGHLKLIDFGIAKDMSRQSISKTVVGSRPFMSPEQIMGQSCLASDVWAMGVLLYILLTDSLPFYAVNEKDMMDMILEMPPFTPRQLNAQISQNMESVMLRCLEKDLTKRYADAGELREELMRLVPDFGKG